MNRRDELSPEKILLKLDIIPTIHPKNKEKIQLVFF